MSENSAVKETTATGWLRDGLTCVTNKLTFGGVLKRQKVSGRTLIQEITLKKSDRFYVSAWDAGKDVARGFFRSAVSALFTAGGVLRHFNPAGFFSACYLRAYQWMVDPSDSPTYGRFYQSMTDCNLSTGGIMRRLYMGQEITIVKIKGVFQAEKLLWEDITNASLYSKAGD